MNLKDLSRKKLILIVLAGFLCIIVLFGIYYQQTALWTPEQSLITLLPESPVCYMTFKDLEGTIKSFNKSEFGKQVAKMPIFGYIKKQLWWRELVYQKAVWEYEMGGRFDLAAFNGHFGKEVIFALYQSEGELSFLLITEVGGKEKLAIEAITATDAINPNYKRIQSDYNGFTINTITGYPLDFSYAFIGKIGLLSLNPLHLADVIDIYNGKKDSFLSNHPKKQLIQESYEHDRNTGYIDITYLAKVLKSLELNMGEIIEPVSPATNKSNYLTFGNRYEDGTIVSNVVVGDTGKSDLSILDRKQVHVFLPDETAFVSYNPDQDLDGLWDTLNEFLLIKASNNSLAKHLKHQMTIALISLNKTNTLKLPTLVMRFPIKNRDGLINAINAQKMGRISVAGKQVEFLQQQSYNGINIQPVRIRLNLLMSLTGAYTVFDNDFFFSTTVSGIKSIVDTRLANTDALSEVVFSKDKDVFQTYIQPDILIPEIRKYLPTISLLVSLSGQKMDAKMTQHISQNIFPLESLGAITIDVYNGESGMDTEIRIDLQK